MASQHLPRDLVRPSSGFYNSLKRRRQVMTEKVRADISVIVVIKDVKTNCFETEQLITMQCKKSKACVVFFLHQGTKIYETLLRLSISY